MRKLLVLFALFTTFFSTATSAQTWSGFYVGAHGGYAWADADYPGQNPYVAPPAPCGDCGPPRPDDLEGGLIGGHLGYNFAFSNVVVGIEADYSFANLTQTLRDGNYLEQTHEIDGLGSVRGRLGYAIGSFLPYATVGWGWASASVSQSCPGDPAAVVAGHCKTAGSYDLKDDKSIDGWVVGGGVEYLAAQSWVLRGEFLHYDFGENDFDLGTAPSGKVIPVKTLEHDVDVLRLAVSYKFGN
jgi:outer membrane immunogenic protein